MIYNQIGQDKLSRNNELGRGTVMNWLHLEWAAGQLAMLDSAGVVHAYRVGAPVPFTRFHEARIRRWPIGGVVEADPVLRLDPPDNVVVRGPGIDGETCYEFIHEVKTTRAAN
jgi:hypothetical protein